MRLQATGLAFLTLTDNAATVFWELSPSRECLSLVGRTTMPVLAAARWRDQSQSPHDLTAPCLLSPNPIYEQ